VRGPIVLAVVGLALMVGLDAWLLTKDERHATLADAVRAGVVGDHKWIPELLRRRRPIYSRDEER
jgi:hypothetical protein